jgi:hypothetical protein
MEVPKFFKSKLISSVFTGCAIGTFISLPIIDAVVKEKRSLQQIGTINVGTNVVDVSKEVGIWTDYVFSHDGKKILDSGDFDSPHYFILEGYKISYDQATGPYTITELPKTQRVELSKLER